MRRGVEKCVGVWGSESCGECGRGVASVLSEVKREVWRSVRGVRKSVLRCGGSEGRCRGGEGRVVGGVGVCGEV